MGAGHYLRAASAGEVGPVTILLSMVRGIALIVFGHCWGPGYGLCLQAAYHFPLFHVRAPSLHTRERVVIISFESAHPAPEQYD